MILSQFIFVPLLAAFLIVLFARKKENFAAAIALAVHAAREKFGQDVIMVTLAADHVIKKQKR